MEKAAKVGRAVWRRQQRLEDLCGEGSKGRRIWGRGSRGRMAMQCGVGSRGQRIYVGEAADLEAGGSVWRRQQRSEDLGERQQRPEGHAVWGWQQGSEDLFI